MTYKRANIAILAAALGLGLAAEAISAPRGGARTAARKPARQERAQEASAPAPAPTTPEADTKDKAAAGPSEAENELIELAKPKNRGDNPYAHINDDNCEFHYNICMNKICTDKKTGKCVCYEDMHRNTNSTEFAMLNGNRVKKGFDLFAAAKRSCEYVVDNCMGSRRIVTEKYSTMVQRDCIKLAEIESMKDRGLYGELQELKACAHDHCTATNYGHEEFGFPELGLCFDRLYANFALDAHCSNIIAKSKTPAALKRLFFDNMKALREQSCARMNGRISADRTMCYIAVSYGPSKAKTTATREVAVGDIMTCSAGYFGSKIANTYSYNRKQFTDAVLIGATAIRFAGSLVGGLSSNPLATNLVESGLDIAASGVDIAITHKQLENGEISEEQAMAEYKQYGLGMAMSAVSIALSFASAARGAASAGTGALEVMESAGGEAVKQAAAEAAATGAKTVLITQGAQMGMNLASKVQVAGKIMQYAATAIEMGANVADIALEDNLEKERRSLEEQDIIKTTHFQNRDAGIGTIDASTGIRGACFINGEWFATENEVLMLQWTL